MISVKRDLLPDVGYPTPTLEARFSRRYILQLIDQSVHRLITPAVESAAIPVFRSRWFWKRSLRREV